MACMGLMGFVRSDGLHGLDGLSEIRWAAWACMGFVRSDGLDGLSEI